MLAPQIDGWRAMVDSVMIDPAYDGQVFNIALADVPPKKSDLVAGEYELQRPPARRPWRSRSPTCSARRSSSRSPSEARLV